MTDTDTNTDIDTHRHRHRRRHRHRGCYILGWCVDASCDVDVSSHSVTVYNVTVISWTILDKTKFVRDAECILGRCVE